MDNKEYITTKDNGNDDIVSIRSERQIMEEILELYKDLPCLWDVSNNLYKNKQARHNSLEILLTKWKTIDKNITLEGVKKKLENMRTTFFREQKKVQASKSTGAAAADVHKPTLWYYEHLMFLIENQTLKREGVDSFETEDLSNESEIKSKKNKKQRIDVQTQSKQLELLESAEKLLLSQEDPIENIGKVVASQLKEMSKLQRCIAEKLISEIIFHGKLDQLTVNSSISLKGNCIASPHSYSHNRKLNYMPMASPASERSTYTPSPSQSPASPVYEHAAYNVSGLCDPVILSVPDTDSRQLLTENQTLSKPQSSNMPTRNETISTPQSSHTFFPQPNVLYEGNRNFLTDFLIFNKNHTY